MAVARATAADYEQLLLKHLPRGPAWPEQNNLLAGLAQELARAHGRLLDLIDEADPRTTVELLPEWERMAGLPDSCVPTESTIDQRRQALVSRLTNLGGQSRQYFIELAARLGYAISITEFRPHDVDSDVDQPFYGDDWIFAWQVNAPQTTVFELTVDGSVDDPFAWWGNAPLECALRRYAPAHTYVFFGYL